MGIAWVGPVCIMYRYPLTDLNRVDKSINWELFLTISSLLQGMEEVYIFLSFSIFQLLLLFLLDLSLDSRLHF